jgi:hypothetical protein
MLLALWSAYGFETGVTPQPTEPTQKGSLGWYHSGWAEEKKDKAEELTDKYIETLETIDLQENQSVSAPIFQQQKKAIVSNLVRQINALDILNTEEIQAAIRQAELDYYMNLAFKREQDDEAVLMLLLH